MVKQSNKINNNNKNYNRYVYFKSYYDTYPDAANSVYANFQKINKLLDIDSQTQEDETKISYMKQYTDMIKQLAENERNAELRYISEEINALKKYPEFLKTEDGIQLTLFAKNIEQNKPVDYLDIINVLNSLRKNNEEYHKTLKVVKERVDSLDEYLNLKKDIYGEDYEKIQERLKQEYVEKYNNYINSISSETESIWRINEINDTLAENFSNRMAKIFKTLSKDNAFWQNLLINADLNTDLAKLIENLVINYMIDTMTNDNLSFIEWFSKNQATKIQEAQKVTYNQLFDNLNKRDDVSLEKYISKSSEQIADKIISFGSNIHKIIAKYDNNNNELKIAIDKLSIAIKEGEEKTIKQNKKNVGIIFKKLFEDYKEQCEKELKENLKKKKINLSQEDFEKTLTEKMGELTPIVIQKNIKTAALKSSSVAEALANFNLTSLLSDKYETYTPGKENPKDDLVFKVNFSPSNPKFFTSGDSSLFKHDLDNFMKNFIKNYNIKRFGETNPQLAEQAFLEELKKIKNNYTKAIKEAENDEEKKQAIIDEFRNTFFGGVSVKEYHYFNNELGFHGGSLGGSGRVIEAVPNILKMYEIGGINTIDADIIIEALLNCSSDMIGSEVIDIQKIKDYLIGGAAMLMFDEGFVNTENFLKKIKNELQIDIKSKVVHLYHLNTLYLPASYVLQNIYEQLTEIVNDINETMTSKQVKNKLEVINHVKETDLQPPDRYDWDAQSMHAQKEVKIHFLFMAGILDIFENLPNAFQINI